MADPLFLGRLPPCLATAKIPKQINWIMEATCRSINHVCVKIRLHSINVAGHFIKQVNMHIANHRHNRITSVSCYAATFHLQRPCIHPCVFHLVEAELGGAQIHFGTRQWGQFTARFIITYIYRIPQFMPSISIFYINLMLDKVSQVVNLEFPIQYKYYLHLFN